MRRTGTLLLTGMLLIMLLATGACDDDDNGNGNGGGPTKTEEPGSITITIGNLTDMTGPSSTSLAAIDTAIQDMADYYNENNLIPGVTLDVVRYDTQYDPSRFIPGYEWLKEKGADLIWSPAPPGVPTLKARADADKFPIFSPTANVLPGELDGSYIFCLGVAPTYEAYTTLKWIAENDPDFPKDRPAKIGGAAWSDAYSNIWFKAAKDYCEVHPDQYDWGKEFLTDFKFIWSTEIEELKDYDYIYIPTPPQTFAREYRKAGYEATFIGTEVHSAFLGLIDKAGLWDEMDGSYLILVTSWYGEDQPDSILINELLDTRHSENEAREYRINGAGYRAAKQAQMICDIIKTTVEEVGVGGFSTEALVETAKSWSYDLGDIEEIQNFTETKRFSANYYGIFEIQVDESNPDSWDYIVRVSDPAWIPQVTEP